MFKKGFFLFSLVFVINLTVFAQTHIAVPLGNPVYPALEQAQMRGLCAPLPGTKPYSRAMILAVIEEIINNNEERAFGALTQAEIRILEQFRRDFSPERKGLDLIRGTISSEHTWNDVYFSSEFGVGFDFTFAGGYYPIAGGYSEASGGGTGDFEGASHPASGDFFADVTIIAPELSFLGDIGRNLSYGLKLSGFIGKSPRAVLGQYDTAFKSGTPPSSMATAYGQPLAYFPYTYKKRWDGFVFSVNDVSAGGMLAWPNGISIGYSMMPEMAGTFFNNHLFYRFARLDREWAGMSENSSLILNQSAQPFLAFETTITPFDWLAISSLTGVLEYHNATGLYKTDINNAEVKEASETFQNAFSIVMLEINHKNYFHADIGSSVIWPKRFELGYPFPFAENFLYQNNIGDFDNMALFLNLRGQYPGIGKLWLSFFIDDVRFDKELDRSTHAYQIGGSFYIPRLPFSSLTLSYTKIEPYTYTHTRVETPWYGDREMETNYVNFGSSLGHYLPPNSDEILVRFEIIPVPQSMFSLQYQLIRHGADYGDRAVDGSSLWSELTENDQRKFFLQDGAYQWMHILRLRGEYSLTSNNLPIKLFCEIGGVYSYFTDIDNGIKPNSGSPHSYSIIDTPKYPHVLSFIGIIGIQIFPKF